MRTLAFYLSTKSELGSLLVCPPCKHFHSVWDCLSCRFSPSLGLGPLRKDLPLPAGNPCPSAPGQTQPAFPIFSHASSPSQRPEDPRTGSTTPCRAPRLLGVWEISGVGPLGCLQEHDLEKDVYSFLKGTRRTPDQRWGKGHTGNWV